MEAVARAVVIGNQWRRITEVAAPVGARVRVQRPANTKSACVEIWLCAALVHDLIIVLLLTATPSLISEFILYNYLSKLSKIWNIEKRNQHQNS